MATPENRKPHIGANLVVKKKREKTLHWNKFNFLKKAERKGNEQKKTSVKNKLGQILKISKDEWNDRRLEKNIKGK